MSKELEELKLNLEEQAKLDQLIIKSVRQGIVYPILTNKPITVKANIQELVNNISIETLEQFVEKLEKLERESGSSRLKKDKSYYVGTVTTTELADALCLIIRDKQYRITKLALKRQITSIQEELDNLKTPEERRADLEKQLKELQAI